MIISLRNIRCGFVLCAVLCFFGRSWAQVYAGNGTKPVKIIPKKNTNYTTQTSNILIGRSNTTSVERLQISLYGQVNGARRIIDGVASKFANSYSAGVGPEDAIKFSNFDEEVAILRNGQRLSIEGRPLIEDADTLPLYIAKMKTNPATTYEWQFDPSSFNAPGLNAVLSDKSTGTLTSISLSSRTTMSFVVNTTASTSASDRFSIIFFSTADYKTNGNVTLSSTTNWQKYNGSAYLQATVVPSGSELVMVRNGHTLTIDNDFTIAAGKALLLNNGAQMVVAAGKILTVNGSADFNNQPVTFQSSAAGTATLAALLPGGSNVTGATRVTVERYISGLGNRAFRQLSPSVNTTGSVKPFIRDNWQEGANNLTTATNNNPAPGYGTHITGSTTGANGFDATVTGNPSLYTISTDYTAWVPIANTNALPLESKKGYLLFIRGNRSISLNTNASNGNTTLRATGSICLGDQVFTSLQSGQYNFVANPFISPINWLSLYNSNAMGTTFSNNGFIYLDPNVGDRGSYGTVQSDGTVTNKLGVVTDATALNIQSGQAFWVKPNLGVTSVTIHEADKSLVNNRDVFRGNEPDSVARMALHLVVLDAAGKETLADGMVVKFATKYKADIDGEDATELNNFDEDIAIVRDTTLLTIDARPALQPYDSILIFISKLKQRTYQWQFVAENFNRPGLQAWLIDNYLHTETPVYMDALTKIFFVVNANPASSANDRFKVVFRSVQVLPINFTNVKAFEKGTQVQVEWNLGNEQGVKQYQIETSADGRTFTKGGTQPVRTIQSTSNYMWLHQQPYTGNNYYRIKAIEQNGQYRFSQVVTVKLGRGNSAITVYPNPITNNTINLQLVNQPAGKYSIRLLNQLGQEVYRSELNHLGGSATETLQINTHLSKGLYNLQVTGNGKTTVQKVVTQ